MRSHLESLKCHLDCRYIGILDRLINCGIVYELNRENKSIGLSVSMREKNDLKISMKTMEYSASNKRYEREIESDAFKSSAIHEHVR